MRYQDYLDDAALKAYASALNTRARAARSGGRVTAPALRGIILDSAGRCGWCGVSVLETPFEIDHILSIARGGANTADNLALTCPDCNRRKSDKHPARFAAEILAQGSPRSDFLRAVIARYGDPDPGTQLSLFDAPPPTSRRPFGLDDAAADDDEDSEPYIW